MVYFHTKKQRNVWGCWWGWGHWHWGLMWSGDVSCWRVKCGGRLDSFLYWEVRGREMEGGPWKQNSIQNPWTHIGWECMLVFTPSGASVVFVFWYKASNPCQWNGWKTIYVMFQYVHAPITFLKWSLNKKSFVALSLPENDCIGHTIHKKTKFYVFKINECFV